MNKPILITVNTNPKFRADRMGYTIASQVGVIGIGVAADSAAMQWCGFLLLALLLWGLVLSLNKRTTGVSISEARAYLDELVDGEGKP